MYNLNRVCFTVIQQSLVSLVKKTTKYSLEGLNTMSIYYVIRSFAASNAAYVDAKGMSNYCVLDTMDRMHREKEYFYETGEAAFKRRQAVYEGLLSRKHGGAEVTRLEKSWYNETYLINFGDGFVLLKEVKTEYRNGEYINRYITYSIPEEGWDASEPLERVNDIGCINKYGGAY